MKNPTRRSITAAFICGLALLLAACTSNAQISTPEQSEISAEESISVPEPSQSSDSNRASGNYINLGTYQSNQDQYSGTKVVLFFNADWCSTCEVARTNFEASKALIPSDLTIVIVDFDSALELRKQHGVTVQHTFVQIDEVGDTVAKWSGSITIDEIVQNLS